MERINVSMPDPILKKLRRHANKNDLSVAASALKLIELGLIIESKSKDKNEDKPSDDDVSNDLLDVKMKELTIQNAVILKSILTDGFNFNEEKMIKIRAEISSAKAKILKEGA